MCPWPVSGQRSAAPEASYELSPWLLARFSGDLRAYTAACAAMDENLVLARHAVRAVAPKDASTVSDHSNGQLELPDALVAHTAPAPLSSNFPATTPCASTCGLPWSTWRRACERA